jgi:translation initiation factor IF-2
LKIGDPFIAGVHWGKVRALFDERYNKVDEALPAMPVRATGFDGLPEAGDHLVVTSSDIEARSIATQRQQLRREQEFRQIRLITLDDISKQIQIGGVKELNLIIKADVSGSLEALSDSLQKLSADEVKVFILHKGVGSINESDVMLAVASNAVIIGFQVSTTLKAKKLAEKEAVDIRHYNIIYDCINEIRLALEGLLTPDIKEDVTAQVEVRQIFRISRLGAIAGSYVLSGKITRNDRVRILREGLPIFTGTLHSLKRGKDDVREVDSGYECGVMLEGYNDLQVNDIIECFKVVEVMRTLS